MSCPHLWGKYLRSCSASREVYVPSALEFHEYCSPDQDDRFSLCPVYGGSEKSPADEAEDAGGPSDGCDPGIPFKERSVP